MLKKYGAYISAIKDGLSFTRPVCLQAETKEKAVSTLVDVVHDAFPEEQGYRFHAIVRQDGLIDLSEVG
jgi:hypothetical protein